MKTKRAPADMPGVRAGGRVEFSPGEYLPGRISGYSSSLPPRQEKPGRLERMFMRTI